MVLSLWTGKDYEPVEVPTELVRPMVEYLIKHRDWDRDLARFARVVSKTRLDIQDFLLLQAQTATKAPASPLPTARDGVEAAAILDEAEAQASPTAAQQRMAAARAAKAAKRLMQDAITP